MANALRGATVGETGLAGAIAHIEGRFGVHALARGETSERRRGEIVIATKTSLDRVIGGGLAAGEPLAFVGPPSVGKLSLALRAVAGAQAQGGMAAWIDPTASFDPLAAERAGIDLERVMVVRAPRDAVALATASALRSEGFRLVVVDAGEQVFGGTDVDDLAPALPAVRGSPAALLVIAAKRGRRVAVPAVVFERVAWERRFDRTVGWSFSVGSARGESHIDRRAIFSLTLDGGFEGGEAPIDRAEVAV